MTLPFLVELYATAPEAVAAYANRRVAAAITGLMGALFLIAVISAVLGMILHYVKENTAANGSDSQSDL